MPGLSFYLSKIIEAMLISVVVAFAATPLSIRIANRFGIIDKPKDERRVHRKPIPRFGGMGIFLGSMAAMVIPAGMNSKIQIAMLGGLLMYLLGVIDDILDIHAYEECYDLCEKERLDHLVFTTESFVTGTDSSQLEKLRRGFDVYYHLDREICGKVMSGIELMGQMMRTGRFFVGPPLRFVRMAPLKAKDIPSPNALYHGDNYYSAVWLYLAERAMAVDRRYYRRRVHGSSITTAKGKEGVHFQSIMNVIVALCRFEPFQKRAIAADSQERTYLRELVGSMARRSVGVGLESQCQALEEVSPPLPREMLAFMQACFLPMFTMMRDSSGGRCMFSPWRKPLLRRAWACYRENGFAYTARKMLLAFRTLPQWK